ncbi:hypothetical protein AQUCO_00200868v1 [Aquilegia coerulea]|uniref:Uncharacterized protein n=1 Tax=Aquilegia coerulea TaxID=218851 RepID=A0A2G5F5B4_AQUCA|nr:hypothetical protein AQUCO_00200868v1 [Aquilegia coerulea]
MEVNVERTDDTEKNIEDLIRLRRNEEDDDEFHINDVERPKLLPPDNEGEEIPTLYNRRMKLSSDEIKNGVPLPELKKEERKDITEEQELINLHSHTVICTVLYSGGIICGADSRRVGIYKSGEKKIESDHQKKIFKINEFSWILGSGDISHWKELIERLRNIKVEGGFYINNCVKR